MELTHIRTIMIATHWMSALINGDESGMEDEECETLNAWLDNDDYKGQHTTYDYDHNGRYHFTKDAISGLMADCLKIKIHQYR